MDQGTFLLNKAKIENLQAENSRLHFGISEAHHRVKNSFQNLISYINILLGNNENLPKADLKKIINHIHALSSLHDILLEEVREDSDGKTVRLDRVLENLFATGSNDKTFIWDQIPEITTTPRKVVNFCLIISESVETALKYSNSPVKLTVETIEAENRISFCFKLSAQILQNNTQHGVTNSLNELKFANMLAKAEMNTEISVKLEEDRYSISLVLS